MRKGGPYNEKRFFPCDNLLHRENPVLALYCSKVARFEGGFIPKTFHGLHFLFSGEFGQYFFELFACETNLKKKHSVSKCDKN